MKLLKNWIILPMMPSFLFSYHIPNFLFISQDKKILILERLKQSFVSGPTSFVAGSNVVDKKLGMKKKKFIEDENFYLASLIFDLSIIIIQFASELAKIFSCCRKAVIKINISRTKAIVFCSTTKLKIIDYSSLISLSVIEDQHILLLGNEKSWFVSRFGPVLE